ncbi:MAG: helix-turn-helix domain-containing protein [Actinomyces urogenitalis]|uniref:Transcriptional regulator n=1 Tax=Actinomyces urogenitalis TaxID=103621 RepID=A0A2I1KUR5_9ACTO|nr:helix-turn-helix domain-containing protein [Actinomyces urogenitalis]KGF02174.1 transcriptional regulator [Actinomyces urogenitalis S6-C4]MBS5977760.1 helix-turn-helix domain-containing protein [Actinomyces urogenitalis]MDU0865174.1 helix-turn-helix domain-containing protein [Actinomyces urogenitalis]MDU0875659.1 helix-turn-helix domain-containing protein [Actinomyces urogenitalis]MDU0972890.1 helix-turn-helix domain-containing protein [Actinomyces urogenitalis]
MSTVDDDSTRARVLDLIVEKGPVSAAQLARVLDLTPAAVRRHLTALEESGEIQVHAAAACGKRGRGRPARHYVATSKARTSFAEGYSDIATRALSYLQQVAGDKAIDSFAAVRGRDLERRYMPVVEAAGKDPSDRARALADALTLDGYAATVRDVGDGSYAVQLCQGHCPVRDVAGQFGELCEAETQAIARLIGVPVQRLATLAGGDHVCTTHVPIAMPVLRKRTVRAAADTRSPRAQRTEGTR